jgi:tRNA/rRNA methyltransferase/tRNA (cytidine32/uridine32-2'-O)-methyltransferase
MKNFGLTDWVVVSPNPLLLEAPGMHRLAVQSGELLETVRRVDTLAEAVADCTWVVGTTGRVIRGRRRLSPRELSAEVQTRADPVWALVFGDERSGLTNEDAAACDALSFIPTSPEQPSLNLAQAVVVYAYALGVEGRDLPPPPGPALADDAQLRTVHEALTHGLTQVRFILGEDRHAVGDLMATLRRARLTRTEAELWNAALRVVAKRGSG